MRSVSRATVRRVASRAARARSRRRSSRVLGELRLVAVQVGLHRGLAALERGDLPGEAAVGRREPGDRAGERALPGPRLVGLLAQRAGIGRAGDHRQHDEDAREQAAEDQGSTDGEREAHDGAPS